MEPDEYTNLIVAPKGFVFGEREELFRWEGNEKTCTAISAPSSSSLQEEDKILFGLRPCDTYGLAYMDRFFSASTTTSITICAASTCSSSP